LTKFLKSGDGSEIKCEFECHDRNLVNIYLPNQEFRLQFNVFIYQKSDIFIKLDFGKFSVNKGVLPFPTVVTVEKRKKKKEKRERKRKKQARKAIETHYNGQYIMIPCKARLLVWVEWLSSFRRTPLAPPCMPPLAGYCVTNFN
jgi:hypothetical protein